MFVPYSNIGYDKAFCAGTSSMHALVLNRVRFHDANSPSLKCSKFTTRDDEAYENAVWALIEREGMKPDFTSQATINVYGARNFYEFGTRNLHNFARIVQKLQDQAGNPKNFVRYFDIKGDKPWADFEGMAREVRAGNFLLLFAHSTDKDPDESFTGTYKTLKEDCEARGYRWDEVALECDWSKQVLGQKGVTDIPVQPTEDDSITGSNDGPGGGGDSDGFGLNETNTSKLGPKDSGPNVNLPAQDRNLDPNHAILVTGAFDDNTLEVYTTWSNSLQKWGKDMKAQGQWMINPVMIMKIPNLAYQDRSKAQDLMKELNEKYGYTGADASSGCPGTGGSSSVARTPTGNDRELPSDEDYEQSDKPSSASASFSFNGREVRKFNTVGIEIFEITGCDKQKVNWVISKTKTDGSTAHSRFETDDATRSFIYPVDSYYNRYQVTGTCKDKQPFSQIILRNNDDEGKK
jgi:hypothetical protein